MDEISFDYIKSLFDEKYWDVGVLTTESFHRANLHPIKTTLHKFDSLHKEDFIGGGSIHFYGETNTIILIRDGHTWDYTHYQQAVDILERNGLKDCYLIYMNFKEAAILAGLGVRAKNSLIYSYKFGFDCHIAAVRFERKIIDLPKEKRINYNIWNRCVGCDDCAKACPVGAIHNSDKNPFAWWIDSTKCDNFIGLSNHERIPSIKKFWHENVYPELSIDYVNSICDHIQVMKPFEEGGLNGMLWNKNGYSYDGQVVRKNGELVNVPFCRECTSQPRCSKWNGNYPYESIANQEDINIVDMVKRRPS